MGLQLLSLSDAVITD